jgi:hypothetical protein
MISEVLGSATSTDDTQLVAKLFGLEGFMRMGLEVLEVQ